MHIDVVKKRMMKVLTQAQVNKLRRQGLLVMAQSDLETLMEKEAQAREQAENFNVEAMRAKADLESSKNGAHRKHMAARHLALAMAHVGTALAHNGSNGTSDDAVREVFKTLEGMVP